jgi:hypothetical protein
VISPLLSNIYLNYFDVYWNKCFGHLGELIRYADDFVILTSQGSHPTLRRGWNFLVSVGVQAPTEIAAKLLGRVTSALLHNARK